jgi:ABC-type amino acid transport substrate-binding protein
LDRADFYIDDLKLVRESIDRNKLPFDINDYRNEPVGKRAYYPVFRLSERGKTIMALYERGIERLHRSGELKKIFDKYHHPYPAYDIPGSSGQGSIP